MPSEEGAASPEPSGPFDIYESADGPRHVDSPVRRRILAMMRGRERTVSEMLALTGLGKSTLSAHLAQLGREGLLDYREDPKDRRCKRYYLTSRFVGTAGPRKDRPSVVQEADLPMGANGTLPRLLLRSLVAEIASCGLDLEPLVHETGRRVGELIGRDHPARDLDDWVDAARQVWHDNHLGSLVREQGDHEMPLRLRVDACRLCCRQNTRIVQLCQVSAGLLEGMACESLGSLVEVKVYKDDEGDDADARDLAQGTSPTPGDPGCHCVFQVKVTAEPPLI
jgi:uncharacterized protein